MVTRHTRTQGAQAEFTDPRIASSYQDGFEILDWKSPDILWQVVEQPHSQQWEAVIRPVYSSEGYFSLESLEISALRRM